VVVAAAAAAATRKDGRQLSADQWTEFNYYIGQVADVILGLHPAEACVLKSHYGRGLHWPALARLRGGQLVGAPGVEPRGQVGRPMTCRSHRIAYHSR